jgi:hypothetical protein
LKWVYLEANTDLVSNKDDQSRLRTIAEHRRLGSPLDDDIVEKLSPAGKALLGIFMASTPEEFRARLNVGPEMLQRRLDALSPSRFVQEIRAPLILVHGINDPVIPAQQTLEFASAARKNGLDCSLTLLRMYGHVNPILPPLGVASVLNFYLPETARFLLVINHLISLK